MWTATEEDCGVKCYPPLEPIEYLLLSTCIFNFPRLKELTNLVLRAKEHQGRKMASLASGRVTTGVILKELIGRGLILRTRLGGYRTTSAGVTLVVRTSEFYNEDNVRGQLSSAAAQALYQS